MPGPARRTQDKLSDAGDANSSSRKTISRGVYPSIERDVKNEGASGDVHENNETGKSTRAKCQERYLGPPSSKPAACRRGHDSNF